MQIQDKACTTTLEISSKGLGDTAGWVLWYSGNFILDCLPKNTFSSWKVQIPRFVILGGFSVLMYVYFDSLNVKDRFLLDKDAGNDVNSHQHHDHSKWDKEGESGCPNIEEKEKNDPNRELVENGHKKETSISIRYGWILLVKEALLIIFALSFVATYYTPLEYELGTNVHSWSLAIACVLTISLTYLHWYCGINLGGSYLRSGTFLFYIFHFGLEVWWGHECTHHEVYLHMAYAIESDI